MGASQAEAIVAHLISFLVAKCSLFPCLARLLQTACPPMMQQQQQQQAMSIPETLASNLVVRFLSLQKFPEVAAAQASLPQLLCVPLLWYRCPRVLLNVRSCTHTHSLTLCSSTLHCSTALFQLCISVHACSAKCYYHAAAAVCMHLSQSCCSLGPSRMHSTLTCMHNELQHCSASLPMKHACTHRQPELVCQAG